ncbi:MAG: SPFH domain-containing protein [Lachnospiraceae bacterium]|nr:SPFH domain-containing protein [Lachnospiraceae bacterium]
MNNNVQEKIISGHKYGGLVLLLVIALYVVSVPAVIYGVTNEMYLLAVLPAIWMALGWILLLGLKVLKPNEALVLTLFGRYVGTLKGDGFFWVNPFCTGFNPAASTKLGQSGDVKASGASIALGALSGQGAAVTTDQLVSKKISLKVMTLSNSRQKVNDVLGNPVEIAVAVMWRVKDTAKAVFEVDNFKEYLSLQCDTAVRNVVKIYPYDVTDNIDTTGDGTADDGSLRGSTEVVAQRIRDEIQSKVAEAGLEIVDARITYLAYAPEIAAAMLQRQQAAAVVDARMLIVDGAVGMVELALERLNEKHTVELDEERKAAMVSNLLVVLCGNHDAQPVVNSGSLY